jgi:hypothetical protein
MFTEIKIMVKQTKKLFWGGCTHEWIQRILGNMLNIL